MCVSLKTANKTKYICDEIKMADSNNSENPILMYICPIQSAATCHNFNVMQLNFLNGD